MTVDNRTRDELYYRVSQTVLHHCGSKIAQACLFWAYYTVKELQTLGIKGCIQAGSASWLRVPESVYAITEGQPGFEPATHFSYKWDLENWKNHSLRRLPEMHVWVGIVETQELLDLSIGYLPEACEAILGMPWTGIKPPKYLWCKADELPDHYHYTPDKMATLFATDAMGVAVIGGELSFEATENMRSNVR